MMNTYRVINRPDGVSYVAAMNDQGHEYVVTQHTRDRNLVENWCRDLRRAAQVENDRKRTVKGR